MIDTRRWFSRRRRRNALVTYSGKRTLPQIYLPEMTEQVPDVFRPEPGDSGAAARFKWLVSTCLAGVVGVGVIGSTVYGSMNVDDGSGVVSSIRRASLAALEPAQKLQAIQSFQTVARQKSDRIIGSTLGLATKHLIHDTEVQRRGGKDYISIKPYARMVARLATALPHDTTQIPAFNPFKLYANLNPIADGDEGAAIAGAQDVSVSFVDLPGGQLPGEDGMELPENAVFDLVAQSDEIMLDEPYAMRPAIFNEDGSSLIHRASYQPGDLRPAAPAETLVPRNTTVVERTTLETEAAILEGAEVKLIAVRRGNTLMSLLVEAGTERWQAKAIADAMTPTFPPNQLQPGQQVRLTLAPAPSDTGQMDPVRVSVFTGDNHEVTVARNDGGEYVASGEAVELSDDAAIRAASYPQRATLYTSFYHAALSQNLPSDAIQRLLRVHSYDIDFKQPVRPGDSFEVFFDLKDDSGEPGELLYTAMSVESETRRFYRFRSPDGEIDFFDRDGNSAKKFLMRKPVKGGRFTSGFGMRRHPVLGGTKMHLGSDWGAPHGTPILAAGSGVVEAVGRKGGYGNYVRIRHANGYKTAYGHMSSFADNLRPGAKVQQGQVIGLVGNTGVSSGPHLHFEVLVNNRHVNPMTIPVPRGKQLTGRQLAEFYKERARIDELMGRSPVNTRVAAVGEETR